MHQPPPPPELLAPPKPPRLEELDELDELGALYEGRLIEGLGDAGLATVDGADEGAVIVRCAGGDDGAVIVFWAGAADVVEAWLPKPPRLLPA